MIEVAHAKTSGDITAQMEAFRVFRCLTPSMFQYLWPMMDMTFWYAISTQKAANITLLSSIYTIPRGKRSSSEQMHLTPKYLQVKLRRWAKAWNSFRVHLCPDLGLQPWNSSSCRSWSNNSRHRSMTRTLLNSSRLEPTKKTSCNRNKSEASEGLQDVPGKH